MYATTAASLESQASRTARPRPLASRCRARTHGSSKASRVAVSQVRSVLPLSAIVIIAGYGRRSCR
jgi:hypothetical protein